MGNRVHDTTFDLPEIWDGLQGPDHNDARTTSMAQLCNGAGNHSNPSVVFFGIQDHLLTKDAK